MDSNTTNHIFQGDELLDTLINQQTSIIITPKDESNEDIPTSESDATKEEKKEEETVERHPVTDEEYYEAFKKTQYYQDHPEFQQINPFDMNSIIDRISNKFPYHYITDFNEQRETRILGDDSGEKNIIQMWLDLSDDVDKETSEDAVQEGTDTGLSYEEFTIEAIENDLLPNKIERKSWLIENPNYKYMMYKVYKKFKKELLTFYRDLPEVILTFNLLPKVILKADFGRYLMLFLKGGVYGDIDTYCQSPIDTWFGSYSDSMSPHIGFMTGIEADINLVNSGMPRRNQLIQWTFKTRKHHPFLSMLIAKIVKVTFTNLIDDKLVAYADEFKDVDVKKSFSIMDWTGPAVFTDVLNDYLTFRANKLYPLIYVDIESSYEKGQELIGPNLMEHQIINWKTFTGLQAPVYLEDVAVLPVSGFRAPEDCGINLYCYVSHKFAGTWKKGENSD
ncbi:unnamed protein product [[Candida] boidinii]|nr:unnamed protein product [[Candida] boidinii]